MSEENLQTFNKIIIPLDGSKTAERALRYTVGIASVFKAEIIVLSVVSKKSIGPFKARLEEISPELMANIKDMPPFYLMQTYHEITLKAIEKRNIAVKSVIKEDDISKKSIVKIILGEANEERADLIVISSHGRKGFQKLTEGSLTQELIAESPIPVLVIKR